MARKTPGQRLIKEIGIFPFAPARLMRSGGFFNAAASIFGGRDLDNNFQGSGTRSTQEARRAGARGDVVALWRQPASSVPFAEKVADTFKMWIDHSISTVTSVQGFQRTAAPAIVGEIIFQGAKALKANKLVPAAARPFVRVY